MKNIDSWVSLCKMMMLPAPIKSSAESFKHFRKVALQKAAGQAQEKERVHKGTGLDAMALKDCKPPKEEDMSKQLPEAQQHALVQDRNLARKMEQERRRREADSGLRFHYVAAGERGKPLMLLLHGFPEFWYSWRHQLREFKSEYRVVALDLRGYGETDAPSHKENYKLDFLITDIKDILESLGYNKCVLIGHDWGGMIAWLVAICYPEMVTKLIVVNFPHPSVFTEYILRHPSQLIKSGYYFFFQMPWFPEFMFTVNDFKVLKSLFTSQTTGIGRKGCRLTAEDIEAYLYVFSQPGALTGPINHYRNIFSCLPLQQHEVIMPTLLLWGERDAFMEVEMAEITRIYVKNHFRLTILSEASHWLQQDQPDIVNKLIWTFLKEDTTRKRE
uniref:Epoxide hydrolase 4 n=1 Tax=Pavo cristatus TaxID=9049 RepID=A0A8C9FB75_PAVCR